MIFKDDYPSTPPKCTCYLLFYDIYQLSDSLSNINKRLKMLVGDLEVHIPGGKVTSHSFRAGVATEMARAGHTESELMAVGQWSSLAYRHYIKMPLSHRANITRKIALMT